MIRIIISITVILIWNNTAGQTKYQNEVKGFLVNILADTSTYSLQNFLDDSLKLSKKDPFEFEYKILKQKIDTCSSKFTIKTADGRMHFEKILLINEADYYHYEDEKKRLIKLLSNDSIFQVKNPFNKEAIEGCINTYTEHKKLRFADLINVDVISKKELNQILEKYGGWEDFYGKYGSGFVQMTLPIFDVNYEYAYFKWSYSCGGLCGYGYSGLHKKQNGRWIPIKVILDWIS